MVLAWCESIVVGGVSIARDHESSGIHKQLQEHLSKMERASNTDNISILIVGGGIAGLSFAIEAHRKGHNVRVIERRPPGENTGKNRSQTTSK